MLRIRPARAGRAARTGAGWVRRGCLAPSLMRYYAGQGFTLVREQPRGAHRLFLLARRAERIDLASWDLHEPIP
ncbi:hypothetical protein [Bailinhaonella thermotolerans]|uniref:hypothetical protein n=1 Tax=Bailinhaonella thermotolerans TaxID=1070861 RepID=UPI0011C499DE|nr:hypothetical protein [Bailinhaonella thermotolerans]